MATDHLLARRPPSAPQAAVRPTGGTPDPNELLDRVLAECLAQRGGAVHVDVAAKELTIRVRANGVLHEAMTLKGTAAKALRACLAARAGLAAGQGDGRLAGSGAEWLVHRLDTDDGARMVLTPTGLSPVDEPLAAIGMPPALIRTIDSALFDTIGGVVVVAGPPGSGCAGTLQALLGRLNVGTRRLFAIEQHGRAPAADDGIGRIVVDPADKRGTASALRQVLRQDPDIVLLGDVPDRETAQMVFEAARGRRLLLIGLAADDAVGAIAQLRALRVERFLLASTLRLVVAQRQVQRLCPDCRQPVQASAAVSALLGFDPGAVIHVSDGCESCGRTGQAGHMAVFEAIACDSAISRLLNDGGDSAVLSRHAFVAAPNLGSAARAMVRAGQTTPEEALRISRGGAAMTSSIVQPDGEGARTM
ncbi:GspE/PulE family protein [Sphingomonas sp. 37zxx]|uniref:GspE/PulE family protein n=1 Tax=Sphingomonas sp. 37zxx TaxID=1550073 RepID=UPI00068D0D32|nr:ATPase, T2SS/T4P/T4SS family [Sphingomonas sp. 37zxx]